MSKREVRELREGNTAAAAVFSGVFLWVEVADMGREFPVGFPLITK